MSEASRTPFSEPPDAPEPSGWKRRLRRLDGLLNRKSNSPRVKNILLAVSLVAFAVIAVVSYLALPDGIRIRWWLMVPLIAVSAPLNILVNASEYMVIARIAGTRPRLLESLRLSLIASAANLLPIPGSVMIRTQALRADGVSSKKAIGVSAVAGGAWVGVGVTATGVLLLPSADFWWIGAIGVLVGIAALATVWLLIRRYRTNRGPLLFAQLVGVELATVALGTVRMLLAFAVLGMDAGLTVAIALTTPAILAAAIGIFPAGLGIREGLAAVISVAFAAPVAESVVATAADRVASQIGLAIVAGLILLIGGRRFLQANTPSAPADDADPVRLIADARAIVDLEDDVPPAGHTEGSVRPGQTVRPGQPVRPGQSVRPGPSVRPGQTVGRHEDRALSSDDET